MGVHGMDAHSGFTTPNMLEAETDRALVEAGRRLVVVADHTKWGVIGLSSIARLDQADVLITDGGLDPRARRPGRPGPRAHRASSGIERPPIAERASRGATRRSVRPASSAGLAGLLTRRPTRPAAQARDRPTLRPSRTAATTR